MAGQSPQFQGWLAHDKNSIGNLQWGSFEPKPWEETDVDIRITHCGICGSDLHTLSSGWGPTNYPCVVGHEIVGEAIRVGSQVKHVKVGDRVGVGAQSDSCQGRKQKCDDCANDRPNICTNRGRADTYNSTFLTGGKSYGGYATHNRCPGAFVIPIPDGVDTADAAPMLCGGITTYAPLKNNGCGPGKRVGIKREAQRRPPTRRGRYIATEDDEGWHKKHASSLDIIICTVSSPKMPLRQYLGLLRSHGVFIQVGAPEEPLPPISAFDLMSKERKIGGSSIGPPSQIREMLQLAAEKGIKPWVEKRSMRDANQAVVDMDAGRARYRYTLCNE
ncbi:NADP-dependent alcohol dehydrogenase 7 [Cyphellophora attinorum]|uniref:NADP-dependent alcohol dehydrogenase 7 n=1 Tax=Cyphellophora attinorum TaxID=1664694 RepID=A0A0N1P1K5_9EURO|nr:NADP-dependent alcohol dehydrogenase 7 [Phialophora attinorum]KPI45330.1 NADP-dependent alcohol dehydrogenase 7 [Phialophora attinorum]